MLGLVALPLLGFFKGIFTTMFKTEIGRILMAVVVTYFVAYYRAHAIEEAKYVAKVEESRKAAETIDKQAQATLSERAREQQLAAEARAATEAQRLKELQDAAKDNDCDIPALAGAILDSMRERQPANPEPDAPDDRKRSPPTVPVPPARR